MGCDGTHKGRSYGYNQNLPGTQPERPLPSKVLGDDRDEPLQTSQDRSMDHDRSRRRPVWIRRLIRSTIFEVESLWELEIQLNRRALERPFQSVFDRDVYLGTVERSVSRVYLPVPRVVFLERLRELLFYANVSSYEANAVGNHFWSIIAVIVSVRWENLELNREPRNTRRSGGGDGDEEMTHSLSFIPSLDLTEVIFWSSGEF